MKVQLWFEKKLILKEGGSDGDDGDDGVGGYVGLVLLLLFLFIYLQSLTHFNDVLAEMKWIVVIC